MGSLKLWLNNLIQATSGEGMEHPIFILVSILVLICAIVGGIMWWLARPKYSGGRQITGDVSSTLISRMDRIESLLGELRSNNVEHAKEIQKLSDKVAKIQNAAAEMATDLKVEEEFVNNETQKEIIEEVSAEVEAVIEEVKEEVKEEKQAEEEEANKQEALALDAGLKKTREGIFGKLKALFSKSTTLKPETIDELEALLIGSDLGVVMVNGLIDELKEDIKSEKEVDEADLKARLKERIKAIVSYDDSNGEADQLLEPPSEISPFIIMLVGVNGSGKTTTTAKLAARYLSQGKRVLLAAADTFRAAACDQLEEWGNRLEVPVVRGADGAKPASVAFDAMQRAQKEKFDVLIIDTAGRLHTQSNLMQELEGIKNIVKRLSEKAPHETILVVDGSSGQNALEQARQFNESVPLTGIVVTKLDGTPKGGIVAAIKAEIGVPIKFIGVGESVNDLRPFNPTAFVEALFAEEE